MSEFKKKEEPEMEESNEADLKDDLVLKPVLNIEEELNPIEKLKKF